MTLKSKVLIALLVPATALVIIGLFGITRLNRNHERVNLLSQTDIAALKIANDFAVLTARLEAHYLPKLVNSQTPSDLLPNLDEDRLKNYRDKFESNLQQLRDIVRKSDKDSPEKLRLLKQLDKAATEYFAEFSPLFSPNFAATSFTSRIQIKDKILEKSNQLAAPIDSLNLFIEKGISLHSQEALAESKRAKNWFVIVLVTAALSIGLLYRSLISKVIHPLELLTESINKVQRQQFDQALPLKSDDEIGSLTRAFNDMAAELRIMKMQSDHEVLRLNAERKAIVEKFPHPIFILNAKGKISQTNPEGELLFTKISKGNRLPGKVGELVKQSVDSQNDYLPQDVNKAYLFRRDEQEYWYLPRIFQLELHDGIDFNGWAVVLVDVTKVRWMDAVKTDLIGTVSHEIRTPITSIRMILHLFKEQKLGNLNQKQSEMIASAIADCERLIETLNDLLGLSKLTDKNQEFEELLLVESREEIAELVSKETENQ